MAKIEEALALLAAPAPVRGSGFVGPRANVVRDAPVWDDGCDGVIGDDLGHGSASSAGRSAALRQWQGKTGGRGSRGSSGEPGAERPPTTRVVGRRFEHLVREALLAHPGEWNDRFDEIWHWDDWPDRWGPDQGIDLVARQTEHYGGGFVAIQCKYRPTGQIRTAEIESFLSESGTRDFTARLLVTNAQGIQRAGRQKMQRAEPRCEVLHTKDMDDWVPDWTEFVYRCLLPGDIRFERHQLRPYQEEALRDIRRGFRAGARGKLILPCGTGKSFIALRAAEEAVGDGGTVLYLVPSIALMGQTMREWSRQRDQSLRHSYLAVCSDATAGRRETSGDSGLAGDLSELAMPVTTDAKSLAETLSAPLPRGTMRVVFSTYHSTPVVADAVARIDRTAAVPVEVGMETPADDERLGNATIGNATIGNATISNATTGHADGQPSGSAGGSTSRPSRVSGFRFDLIVADEAHRTTGLSEASATAAEKRRLAGSRYHGISPFNLVHHKGHLPALRRLYMTATPRVFTPKQRRDLEEGGKYDDSDSYSMDDPKVYGEEFHRMSFAEAIDGDWLSDYQVLVIARSTRDYEAAAGADGVVLPDGKALDTESAVKLGGCWDALATPESDGTLAGRRTGEVRGEWGAPARSAIAFCSTIKTSKKVASAWEGVAEWHRKRNRSGRFLDIEVDHLDAKTPAVERASLIGGLRRHAAGDTGETRRQPRVRPPGAEDEGGARGADEARIDNERATCRVLTNVRVLAEGVDVPALDAVVFLESRASPIDVTQAVGRVMRRAPGKETGYIVIPVVVDQFGGGTPEERARRLLREGNFKPVWDVVRALRAHDERIDYWLNAKRTDRVRLLIDGIKDDRTEADEPDRQLEIPFDFGDSFASLLLDNCGDRKLYANWGNRAASVCRRVKQRVTRLVEQHAEISEAFDLFLRELRRLIGQQQITREAAAEMLAQHVVTIPVFEHVVTAADFAHKNPLALALGHLLGVFREHGHGFEEELRPLTRAYRSMEQAFRGAASGAERLNVLKEIYESFFKAAMPAAVKSLGIVYTPVEIVDFMLRSVDAVCRDQFGKGLTAGGVHVLDPFTGTGTFLNRLLAARDADGEYLVRDEDLDRKYGRPATATATATPAPAGAGEASPATDEHVPGVPGADARGAMEGTTARSADLTARNLSQQLASTASAVARGRIRADREVIAELARGAGGGKPPPGPSQRLPDAALETRVARRFETSGDGDARGERTTPSVPARAATAAPGEPGEMHAALRVPGLSGSGDHGDHTERGELHANEIVLLAYYIAALKIEEARFERIAEWKEESTKGPSGEVSPRTDEHVPGAQMPPGVTEGTTARSRRHAPEPGALTHRRSAFEASSGVGFAGDARRNAESRRAAGDSPQKASAETCLNGEAHGSSRRREDVRRQGRTSTTTGDQADPTDPGTPGTVLVRGNAAADSPGSDGQDGTTVGESAGDAGDGAVPGAAASGSTKGASTEMTELAAEADARSYEPFRGIVLTDTFLMSERQAALQFNWQGLDEAGRRVSEQNRRRIRVIVGNPPWSAGKKAAGDESVEVEYRKVAERVSDTYVRALVAVGGRPGGNAAGNLFVKAFRWASDRLEGGDGIVCFVHPNSLADAPSLAGMRKALRDEFTDIHVVNLRGNAYKSGEERRNEGDPMFGQGTRNGSQITVLVRNQDGRDDRDDGPAALRYAEVPDGLSLDRKFEWLADLGHVLAPGRFQDVPVNDGHDWVKLGDPTWDDLLPVCGSSIAGADSGSVSGEDASGVKTNLDAYVYSFSWLDLCERVEKLIAEFNRALKRWQQAGRPKKGTAAFDRITGGDAPGAIKWTDRLKATLLAGEPLEFDSRRIREVLYRPFTKLWLYEDYRILSAGGAVSRMFPRSAGSSLSLSLSRIETDRNHLLQPDATAPVRSRGRRRTPRPLCHGTPDPSGASNQAVLISGTNMPFQALATATLPDLASIKGSQQTRVLPRRMRTT